MKPSTSTQREMVSTSSILQKSVGMVDDAYNAIGDMCCKRWNNPFCWYKEAGSGLQSRARLERCGMYYVNERWLGGMLTNFKTIQTRIARLSRSTRTMEQDGTFDVLPKKEVIQLKEGDWRSLQKNLGGIKDMKRIPDADLRR